MQVRRYSVPCTIYHYAPFLRKKGTRDCKLERYNKPQDVPITVVHVYMRWCHHC